MGKSRANPAEVAHAWKLAEEASASQIRSGKLATSLGLEVRYALSSCDDSRKTRIPISPSVLVDAVVKLMPYLPKEELVGHALEMALEVARTTFGKAEAKALARAACHLPESGRKMVLQEAVWIVAPLHDTEGEQLWSISST